MGDRIAILGELSRILQIDTPERILAFPVDDFVNDFIGSGSTLKGLHFEKVVDLDLDRDAYPTMTPQGAALGRPRAPGPGPARLGAPPRRAAPSASGGSTPATSGRRHRQHRVRPRGEGRGAR